MVILRMDYLRITDEDHCAAVLLNYFAFRTKGLLDSLARSQSVKQPWHVATYADIAEGLCNHYNYKAIKEALDFVIRLGYVTATLPTRAEPGRFLFNVPAVKAAISRYAPPEVDDSIGSSFSPNEPSRSAKRTNESENRSAFSPNGIAEKDEPFAQKDEPLKEEILESSERVTTEREHTPLPLIEESENEQAPEKIGDEYFEETSPLRRTTGRTRGATSSCGRCGESVG